MKSHILMAVVAASNLATAAYAIDSSEGVSLPLSKFVLTAVPRGSARTAFDADNSKGMKNVVEHTTRILAAHGYDELGWFVFATPNQTGETTVTTAVPDSFQGIGAFTKVEQYDSDGHSLPDTVRWKPEAVTPSITSFGAFFKKLLDGKPAGNFRAFFVALSSWSISNKPSPGDNNTFKMLFEKRMAGSRGVTSSDIRNVSGEFLKITVVVYEFKKSPTTGEVTLVSDSGNGIDFHLNGSGLSELRPK